MIYNIKLSFGGFACLVNVMNGYIIWLYQYTLLEQEGKSESLEDMSADPKQPAPAKWKI